MRNYVKLCENSVTRRITFFSVLLQNVFGKWQFQTPGKKRNRAMTYCGSENDLG